MANNELDNKHFQDLKKHIRYNYKIADFYLDRYEAEFGEIPEEIDTPNKLEKYLLGRKQSDISYEEKVRSKWLAKSKNIFYCCKYFDIDYYMKLKVKNVKRVNLCRDKFCFNCQKAMAGERQARFTPQLDELRKDYEVFHLVMTVPNCRGKDLKSMVETMYKQFPHLLKYFKGQGKVKGVDFLAYGYAGAVRALEITQNRKTELFHPHFHCMILFKKGLVLEKKIKNPYSFKQDDDKIIYFSAFEILLQKIWFLLINGERVTKKAIDELKLGYDVHMSDSVGNYHEVFKYVCKGFFDEDNMFVYSSDTFWTLYEVLHNRRIIQGYGLLYNFDDCEDILSTEADFRYETILFILREIEKPTFRIEELDEVIERCGVCRYFTKSSVRQFLQGKRDEIETKAMLAADGLDNFFDEPVQLTIDEEGKK